MIVITGANGFIGRSLRGVLAEHGLPFRAVSRNPSPGCIAIGDMTQNPDWSTVLTEADIVIHLAGRAHVLKNEGDAAAAFAAVNVDATLAVAREAAVCGVRRFVFVSSIKANGEVTRAGQPFCADDVPLPSDDYGRSKAEAERQLFERGRETGMEIVVVRPPLVYGPDAPANFARILKWAGSGLPSPFGAVHNSRSMIYVENLCDLLLRAAVHPNAAGEVFLGSDGLDLSTRELFSVLAALQGKRPRNLPIPPALMKGCLRLLGMSAYGERLLANLQVDIGKTRRMLQWTPPISLEEGLRTTVALFRNPSKRRSEAIQKGDAQDSNRV